MKSKYEQGAEDYIDCQKKVSLESYKNIKGEIAEWDDYLWIINNPLTQKSYKFYFLDTEKVKRPHHSVNYTLDQMLSGDAKNLAKSYLIDLVIQRGLKKYTSKHFFIAKEILLKVKGKIWALTQDQVDSIFDAIPGHKFNLYKDFFKHCQDKGFLSKSIRLNRKNKRDTSVESALEKQNEKMPDEQIILATGSIFHSIVPHELSSISLTENTRDRFVSCMTVFALSSPNRMFAEQLLLSKQKLKKKSVIIPTSQGSITESQPNDNHPPEEQLIHWLDWQGSKGYKNNRNHILNSMSPFVERAINYLDVVCEPARVLCRYYSNQNAKLKYVLGDFKPKSLHGLKLDNQVNLFQLGGLLGFYENNNKQLDLNGFPYSADVNTKFNWTARNANLILGTSTNLERKWLPFNNDAKFITLSEIEKLWILHIKESVPSFPYRYIGDLGKKVKLENAMCIFTGFQVGIGSGRQKYKSSAGYYAIEGKELDGIISKSLARGGIFQRNGFTNSFHITSHQFRHYLNTKLQDSDISELLIAMISGRLKVESNAVYDHTSDSAKVAQIAHINNPNLERNIKVHTKEEYEIATGKVVHAMSTGICTQQLHQTPCTHLNDFLTQCVGCRSSCHLNRDVEAIELLEQDLAIQQYRLEEVKNSPNIKTNPIRQSWFKTHHTNVFVLEELIKLMKSHEIKEGSLIRYAGDESAFQLIDIQKRKRIDHKISLPNSQKALEALLMDLKKDNTPSSMQGVDNLLTKLGVSI